VRSPYGDQDLGSSHRRRGRRAEALEFAKKDGSALVIPTAANVVGVTDQTDLFFKMTDALGIKR